LQNSGGINSTAKKRKPPEGGKNGDCRKTPLILKQISGVF
jgi:hypothetical protein